MYIFYFIIETANDRGISLAIRLPGESKLITASHIIKCFNHYANPQYRKSFFKPRCVIGNPNNKEVEDLLTKYLIESIIKDYSKIQILLSELIANINISVPIDINKIDDISLDDIIELCNEINLTHIQEKINRSEIIYNSYIHTYSNIKIDNIDYSESTYGKIHLYELYTVLNQILVSK